MGDNPKYMSEYEKRLSGIFNETKELIRKSKNLNYHAKQMQEGHEIRKEKAREKLHHPNFYKKMKEGYYKFIFVIGVLSLILSVYSLNVKFTGNTIGVQFFGINAFSIILFLFGLFNIILYLRIKSSNR